MATVSTCNQPSAITKTSHTNVVAFVHSRALSGPRRQPAADANVWPPGGHRLDPARRRATRRARSVRRGWAAAAASGKRVPRYVHRARGYEPCHRRGIPGGAALAPGTALGRVGDWRCGTSRHHLRDRRTVALHRARGVHRNLPAAGDVGVLVSPGLGRLSRASRRDQTRVPTLASGLIMWLKRRRTINRAAH
eukprot:1774893-Prymnesium_polylepis.1